MREETWIWKTPDIAARPAAAEDGQPAAAPAPVPDRGGPSEEIFDLFVEFFSKKRPLSLKVLIDELEKRLILTVLLRARGNQKEAARALGLKYTTLNEKVKRYGLAFRR